MKGMLSRLLQRVLSNTIVTKRIKGTHNKLTYEQRQHLNFFGKRSISYDFEIQSEIKQLISPGNLIYDIGANIGQYTIFFSDCVGETGKVVSVEPDPINHIFLRLNIIQNNLNNVSSINKGLGASQQSITFYRDSVTGGRRGSFDRKYVGENYEGSQYPVETTTLEDLIKIEGIPDLIKIDVEGFEYRVLTGLKSHLKNTIFFIEVRTETKSMVFNFFDKEDYYCKLIENNSLKTISHSDKIPDFANLLFLPAFKQKDLLPSIFHD